MHLNLLSLIFCVFCLGLYGQSAEKKDIMALRIEESVKIDGYFDENAWAKTAQAVDFSRTEPQPEGMLSQRSSIKVLYDDKALYIGAQLYDSHPDSILSCLLYTSPSPRDRTRSRMPSSA